MPRLQKLSAFALVLMAAVASSGCAAALGRAALGGAVVRGSMVGGVARMGAGVGLRPLVRVGMTRSLGAAATETLVFRSAATELFAARGTTALIRGQVVTRGGMQLGTIQPTGVNRLVVEGAQSRIPLTAVREGSRVTFSANSRTVGYSEFVGDRVRHYVLEAGRPHELGYDIIRGGRVLQYDASGALIAEATLQRLAAGRSAAVATAAAAAALAASAEADEQLEAGVKGTLSEVRAFLAGSGRQ